MMYDQQRSSALDQQKIITELADKLSRQWIGVQVVLEQWTHVWLRDGIAKLLATRVGSMLMPSLEISEQFNTDVLQSALQYDNTVMSHPVLPDNLYLPDDISDVLVDELYGLKGAAILRWIEVLVGKDTFQDSLRLIITEQ